MTQTAGLNHLGLAVRDLGETTRFFVECLGWVESGRDDSYPRTAVSDGTLRLTLWQVDHDLSINAFHRRQNIGLHHLAIEVTSEQRLQELSKRVSSYPKVKVKFIPEPINTGPRIHMMFCEPGGIRLELVWPGPG